MFYSQPESKVAPRITIFALSATLFGQRLRLQCARFAILTACLLVFARWNQMKSILRCPNSSRPRRRTIKREIVRPMKRGTIDAIDKI